MDTATIRPKLLWITRTGVFIAMLIAWQAVTAPLKNTLLTGSVVNLLLILSVLLCGVSSGVAVAALSPVMAKLLQIGPLWSLIPLIALGNIVFVLLWRFIATRQRPEAQTTRHLTAAIVAALAKFATLYCLIVRLAVPLWLQLPEPQAQMISATFSVPQLFTASIGGAAACLVLPFLTRALGTEK
jgi:hypothetical protein